MYTYMYTIVILFCNCMYSSHLRIRLFCSRLAEKLQKMNYSIEEPKAHKVQIIKDDDKAGG